MKVVQDILGHSTIGLTADLYGHLMPPDDRACRSCNGERVLVALAASSGPVNIAARRHVPGLGCLDATQDYAPRPVFCATKASMSSIRTETETVVKRILPYLRKRGYSPEEDIDFETAIKATDHYGKGYVDLLVTAGKSSPQFLIEAKRSGKKLSTADRKQAWSYAQSLKVPFFVVSNGTDIEIYNGFNGSPIRWDGKAIGKVPDASQLPKVVRFLRSNKDATDVPLASDSTLPFRPGVPLKLLNTMFAGCHNTIRNIEKSEENAFADFSKILFLRLLEEKADNGSFLLPYSYRFWELAERPVAKADQVKDAILTMLDQVRKAGYGDVLIEPIHLQKSATFHLIVKQLSSVSFEDSGLDSKGAAFEYFVRSTLKGKRLGQYFTPRQLVDLMVGMVGRNLVLNSLATGDDVAVLDPACGTGGFLVYMLKELLASIDERVNAKALTRSTGQKLRERAMLQVFHGADANEGVAAAAKMNMIVAGDGHTNIRAEDSLARSSRVWSFDEPTYDLVLTNPPFGTSESSSLSTADLASYPVKTTRGQLLFLQRMVLATKPGGYICTVIDEGVLNTKTAAPVRKWLLQETELLTVLHLPDGTFEPNKITVRSSVLLLRRRESPDIDLVNSHSVLFCNLDSLGYYGSGELIRGFDFDRLRDEIDTLVAGTPPPVATHGYHWSAFSVPLSEIAAEATNRFDLKYWEPDVRARISRLAHTGTKTVASLNRLHTSRGWSPPSAAYVDMDDGYALVVKAGSNVSQFGTLLTAGADYIEKSVYDEAPDRAKLSPGDILLSSTGEGTLGKVCVYDLDEPAVADGHVTVIRVDPDEAEPWYVCDYLRCGFGADQVQRLYTGSTGLIELQPEEVDRLRIELPDLKTQAALSARLRKGESTYQVAQELAENSLVAERQLFRSPQD